MNYALEGGMRKNQLNVPVPSYYYKEQPKYMGSRSSGGSSTDFLGKLPGLLGVGGLVGSLFGLGTQDIPQLNLPEQNMTTGKASEIAARQGAQIRRSGMGSLERTGLETPSRVLGVQSRSAVAQNELLGNLLQHVDQVNMQRAMAEYQAKMAAQEKKGDFLSTLGDVAGTAAMLFL